MFFKRLSRSRSNSQSYVDGYSPHDSKTNSASYDDNKYAEPTSAGGQQQQRSNSSRQSDQADPLSKEAGMYARQQNQQPTEVQGGGYGSPPVSAGGGGMTNGNGNGYGGGGHSRYDSMQAQSKSHEPAPDLLLQAFNQALRPYSDKVEGLESEIADLRAYIDQLEAQRGDVHAWIDKRGLRPGNHLPKPTQNGEPR